MDVKHVKIIPGKQRDADEIGNAKAEELAHLGVMGDWDLEVRGSTIQQERFEVYAAWQCGGVARNAVGTLGIGLVLSNELMQSEQGATKSINK